MSNKIEDHVEEVDKRTTSRDQKQETSSANNKPSLDQQKLELEIKKLKQEISPFGFWARRLSVIVGVVTAFVALFSGIQQFSKATKEAQLKRQNEEKMQINESFDLLWSPSNEDVARGVFGLIQYVDVPEHRSVIYDSLKLRLGVLQPPPISENMGARTEQRRHEFAQIQAMVPLIERFSVTERKELYTILFNNKVLKYGRLVALEKLGNFRDYWESALADDDDEFVEATIFEISKLRPAFAEELLIDVLNRPSDFFVTTAAAEALGNLHAMSAVNDLIRLLQSPDKYVKRSVVRALGSIGDPKAVVALKKAYTSEKDDELRGEIRLALTRLGADLSE